MTARRFSVSWASDEAVIMRSRWTAISLSSARRRVGAIAQWRTLLHTNPATGLFLFVDTDVQSASDSTGRASLKARSRVGDNARSHPSASCLTLAKSPRCHARTGHRPTLRPGGRNPPPLLSYYEDDLEDRLGRGLIVDQRRLRRDALIWDWRIPGYRARLRPPADDALDRSIDLRASPMRSRGDILRTCARFDRLARFSDELSNITKFFGDWHRADLLNPLRLLPPGRLAPHDRRKLKTLDDLTNSSARPEQPLLISK